ncbi:IclR family transcriptional regulator [Micromonospora globispora]|uniref:IclR family transcriptional regulator n=1 Tax=Micromonospora globispora TaxID=1450148 RepID=UPI000D6FFD55|nr:IclR family transcriptional regulator [Micromonospora globispora]PWU55463.1 IclR family transcriptional regulator [Micromonospora globispora]RQW91862.1 IclR family transcriptional regulator [Micromonospora globispora]
MSDRHPPVDTSSVLSKVVSVLFAFTADDHGVSLAELARRTGLAKGTLHRVIGDLVDARLLDRTDRGYRLSSQVFQLGMRASVERGLLEVATPFMEDLYERTHETVHLGVLEGTEVVYVSKIGGHRQVPSPSRIGGRMPVHCTAIGKALLAHSEPALLMRVAETGLERRTPRTITAPGILRRQLQRVVETGVAFEYEESTVGIVCVAAPVLDAADRPVAALSVTGPVTRFRPDSHGVSVKAAAAGMAATLARRDALARREG